MSPTYTAKIDHQAVKVFDVRTGSLKRTIGCSGYKGAQAANVAGDVVSVACGDGRVRVYDIRTGSLKRTL
ncbi:hypothetical protein [Acidovorax sp. sic0104]|uniref:hypothetical protein n=1 Tax=Acidovorax sp. sic0104 TaxID=2854784 RepID=UPI001C4959A8|nr:hypothetical protein [Acidovorax sp. sic0104]MBV7543505.1 hypothetical protein [Acidovorax sp. sic0104]